MSEERTASSQTAPVADPLSADSGLPPDQPTSFLEHFLDSFFQEKNIRWMLVVGAGIVFGSSLMLVNQAWEGWSPELRFLTILGYTGLIFGAAEVSRLRLNLNSTWKVLHSLTLLLLPICFLTVQWLTSGTGTQANIAVFGVLFFAAAGFLWFASSRILDHVLRGRQTTFLISYCLLSVAGAVPNISHPALAFAFLALTWAVFTAGVLKVNRHIFWLTEEHRLPRILGFLPIAMLGLQFVVLVSSKAISAIPVQWTGFACVMAAATVLLTARSVADVFRQRTGDLVRPLPASIVLPTFVGLVLTAIGMVLAFNGFSYIGQSTYAIIPTSIAAAALMWMSAKDTKHTGFVWASLICMTVAWQCSPVLFAETVQTLKQSTAQAINRERVPVSMYGITYLPLLGMLAVWCRRLRICGQPEFAQPMKHYITTVAMVLFGIAFTDGISLFIVSATYIAAFLILAVLFADRFYALLSLVSLIIATGTAVPSLHSMQYLTVDGTVAWAITALAALAAVLTATSLPDRLVNMIPVGANSILRHRDSAKETMSQYSLLLQTAEGRDRCIVRGAGGILTGILTAGWLGYALANFSDDFSTSQIMQYIFLMAAFVLYTLRRPRYVAGAAVWVMIAFALIRWAVATGVSAPDVLQMTSLAAIGCSAVACIVLKLFGQLSSSRLSTLRRQLGLDETTASVFSESEEHDGGWARQVQAFVVPLCDLSLVTLSCLAVVVHLPLLLSANFSLFSSPGSLDPIWISTTATFIWLAFAAVLLSNRNIAAIVALVSPLWLTAHLIEWQLLQSAQLLPAVWAALQGAICLLSSHATVRVSSTDPRLGVAQDVFRISEIWLQGILLVSCVSFSPLSRIAAAVCLLCFVFVDRRSLDASRRGYLAVVANIQLLLLGAAVGGAGGYLWNVLAQRTVGLLHPVPLVFLIAVISIPVFNRLHKVLEPTLIAGWTAILRVLASLLVLVAFTNSYSSSDMIIMLVGLTVAAAIEVRSAVRQQVEFYVWTSMLIPAIGVLLLWKWGVIAFGVPVLFVLLGLSAIAHTIVYVSERRPELKILRRPLLCVGHGAPLLVVLLAMGGTSANGGLNALTVLIAAGIYFQQAMVTTRRTYAVASAVITNIGLTLLWNSLGLRAWEFYLVPIGLSVLTLVELLKTELPTALRDPLRYVGALTILVSPMFEVLDGDLVHMLSLLLLCVLVMLLAIGLRVRVLVYAASAFLAVDVVAMVFHTTRSNPELLWVGGLLVGAGVIALAAVCENHREKLLAQVRRLSAELATWS